MISFADEEGARFATPTFGSRALVGRLDTEDVLARTDEAAVTLSAAMAAAGTRPGRPGGRPSGSAGCAGCSSCTSTRASTSPRPAAAAVVRALAARMRVQVELRGGADHAGTTRASSAATRFLPPRA